jgi:hypothetical protein
LLNVVERGVLNMRLSLNYVRAVIENYHTDENVFVILNSIKTDASKLLVVFGKSGVFFLLF